MRAKRLTKLQTMARALGARGGKVGGAARARKLTPERRSEIARKAAQVRWKGKG